MRFPDFEAWKEYIHPIDRNKNLQQRYEYYRNKYDMLSEIECSKMCEIGVRYGYSAISFLTAHPIAEYMGIDWISGEHGGVQEDTFRYVYPMLAKEFPEAVISLVHANTQEMVSLPTNEFDFIHIDGDHTYEGAGWDMRIAWESLKHGGMMLIDDYKALKEIQHAVNDFIISRGDQIKQYNLVDTFRGDFRIWKT